MSKYLRLLPLVAGVFFWLSAGSATATAAPDAKTSYLLRSARRAGSVDRVVSLLEVNGTLKLPQKGKTEQLKMAVNAAIVYDERTLDVPTTQPGSLHGVRHYDRAEATIDLAEGKLAPTLRPERRLMAVEIDGAKVTIFSPGGRLTRDELDLVDLPANSLLLDRFLPARRVAQGESWTHPDDLILAAFGLDRTAKQTLQSTLAQIDRDAATMEMAGLVEGAVHGVTTRIEVKAKYRFNRKTQRIDWFGMLVRESRDIGHVGPGVDAVARLRMQIESRERSERLADDALANLPLRPSDALTQLVYQPQHGGWHFQHDRRWFSTGNDQRLGFLRFIERGDFIAQCNVAVLAEVEPGKQATLEQFQQDIKHALGNDFSEFVSASQKANEQNYRVLRVVARGTVSGLPIEWHYYLVADEHGRQITFTFTVEQPVVERLGELDQQIVASLRFDPPKVATDEQKTTR